MLHVILQPTCSEQSLVLLQKAEKEAVAAAKAAEEGKLGVEEKGKAPATAQVGLYFWLLLGRAARHLVLHPPHKEHVS